MTNTEAVAQAILDANEKPIGQTFAQLNKEMAKAAIDTLKSLGWLSSAELKAIAQAAQMEAFEKAERACHPHGDDDEMDKQAKAECAAAIRALKPDAGEWKRVSYTHVVVPREPTEEMLNRMIEAAQIHDEYGEDKYVKNMGEVYRVIVAGEKP